MNSRQCEHCEAVVLRAVPGEYVYIATAPTDTPKPFIHIACIVPGKYVRCLNCSLFLVFGTSSDFRYCRTCAGEYGYVSTRPVQPSNHFALWQAAGGPEYQDPNLQECISCKQRGVSLDANNRGRCRYCSFQQGKCAPCGTIVAITDLAWYADDVYAPAPKPKRDPSAQACSHCRKKLPPCGNCHLSMRGAATKHKGFIHMSSRADSNRYLPKKALFCDTCWNAQRIQCDGCAKDTWKNVALYAFNMDSFYRHNINRDHPQTVAQPVIGPCCRDKVRNCRGCGFEWMAGDVLLLGREPVCIGCRTHGGWGLCALCGDGAARTGQGCRDCGNPIGAYDERAPEQTGFLGAPTCHAKCTQVKSPTTRGVRVWKHVKGCTFDGLYMGVELEVEAKDPTQRLPLAVKVKKMFLLPRTENPTTFTKTAIVKHDGSLAAGFEIVSGPATLDVHRKMWDPLFSWQWDKAHTERPLLSHDAPNGTCGLHVHISREALTWLQIGKMVQFLHDEKNRDFVRFISGRPCSNYADFMVPKKLPFPDNGMPARYSLKLDNQNRYTALNLQNQQTVEFRIFRGTLVRGTFMARLEFCHALVKFCAPGVVGLREVFADRFCAWLENNRKAYPYLITHLAKTGWVTNNEKEAR